MALVANHTREGAGDPQQYVKHSFSFAEFDIFSCIPEMRCVQKLSDLHQRA